ncbi:MAG: hypothetical protein EOO27_48980, partial [Comamonadaceae bacterium]
EEALLSIKALLKERTGHDFSHYKRGTVLRRLERRMQVRAVPDLPSYRQLLDVEPKETGALLQDMLISVTNFFRDPDAFDALRSAIAASLIGRPREPFRAWVAGCATGEELIRWRSFCAKCWDPTGRPCRSLRRTSTSVPWARPGPGISRLRSRRTCRASGSPPTS